jgi:hypothetical protein
MKDDTAYLCHPLHGNIVLFRILADSMDYRWLLLEARRKTRRMPFFDRRGPMARNSQAVRLPWLLAKGDVYITAHDESLGLNSGRDRV